MLFAVCNCCHSSRAEPEVAPIARAIALRSRQHLHAGALRCLCIVAVGCCYCQPKGTKTNIH